MNYFLKYRISSGEIVGKVLTNGPAPECDSEDLAYVEGEGGAQTHYVRDGALVEYTQEQREAKGGYPNYLAGWSNISMSWVSPGDPMLGLRSAKWEQVKLWRAEAVVAPTMTTPFGVLHADAQGTSDIKDALLGRREAESLGMTLAPIKWTLVDNTIAELTTTQLGLVAVMLLSRGNTYHQRARALRKQIDDATTPAELDAITRESLEVPLPEESVTTEETA